jgi:hypothetical protein
VAKAQAAFLAVTCCGLMGLCPPLIAERDRHSYRRARE